MATQQKDLNEGNAKHSYEQLKLINDATGEKQLQLLKKWASTPPLSMLLSMNYNHKVKIDLPPGAPPYKRDEETHPDLMTPLAGQIQRMKACQANQPIKKMIKERTFIQILEMIPPGDADLLIACKDRALTEIYPNITQELVAQVFPQYVCPSE